MTISFELPQSIDQELRTNAADLNREAKEAYLVELYRQHKISQHQLAEALGLSRVEADGVLKKHEVWLELTPEELAAQAASLREVRSA
jgi:predicted HTH domain antitoxin